MDKAGITKAIATLVGLVVVFLLTATVFQAVVPDAAGLPKDTIVNTIITVAGAMVTAIVVIGAILAVIYVVESKSRTAEAEKLKKMTRSMKETSSVSRIVVLAIVTLAWMAIIYLFWRQIPIMIEADTGATMPLFADKFAVFVPFFLALGAGTIIANVMYLVFRSKWIPSACDAAMNVVAMVLFYWLIQVFPFNPALEPLVNTGIYLVLVILMVVTFIDLLRKLWQTAKFIIYG